MIVEFLSRLKRVQCVWLFVERALRYARLRALMSCLISRFTHGLIRTSFEGTYLLMMELSVSVNFWVNMSILGSKGFCQSVDCILLRSVL